MMKPTSLFSVLALAIPVPLPAAVDHQQAVKPLLTERCYACHGALKQKGGLRLDTVEAMRKGGHSGLALLPEQPADSPLIERLKSTDPEEQIRRRRQSRISKARPRALPGLHGAGRGRRAG